MKPIHRRPGPRPRSVRPSGQSRGASALESVANVAIGYGIAVATQITVFPWFGLEASTTDHLAIGAIFTAVSLTRSYGLRRLFNQFAGGQ